MEGSVLGELQSVDEIVDVGIEKSSSLMGNVRVDESD